MTNLSRHPFPGTLENSDWTVRAKEDVLEMTKRWYPRNHRKRETWTLDFLVNEGVFLVLLGDAVIRIRCGTELVVV